MVSLSERTGRDRYEGEAAQGTEGKDEVGSKQRTAPSCMSLAALEEESREMASSGGGDKQGSERDSSVEARVRCRWGGWA